ncbi:MAG: ion transporter [Phycisphaerales bacterium]|nr:ion transporter [Phycisphaerales bacterium]
MIEQTTPASTPDATDGDGSTLPSAYDLFVAIAAVVSIGVITWQLTLPATSEVSRLLEIFDWAFCALFLVDYLRHIVLAKNKLKYIFTWGIFDLGSSIPAVGPLRYARVARLLRIVRMLRAGRMLAEVYRRDRTAFAVALLMAAGLITVIGVSAAVLHVERDAAGATITTGPEAAWWGVVTVSTVGYGDITPVTDTGRVLAVILMVVGIGLFATFAGAVANVFTRQVQRSANIDSLEDRLIRMERHQRDIHTSLKKLQSPAPDD